MALAWKLFGTRMKRVRMVENQNCAQSGIGSEPALEALWWKRGMPGVTLTRHSRNFDNEMYPFFFFFLQHI